jgi:hypothetical protein
LLSRLGLTLRGVLLTAADVLQHVEFDDPFLSY